MFGSILTRGATLILGYLYPAYDCFKSLERRRMDVDDLRFWCQYWIIIAAITVCERVADPLISWVPFYAEAKLAFVIYLWHPRTKGSNYVYSHFVLPLVAQHEPDIDRRLAELHTRAGDAAFHYLQVAIRNGHALVLEVLRYVAAQAPRNRLELGALGQGAEGPPPQVPPSSPLVAPPQPSMDSNNPWADIWPQQDRRAPPPRYRVVVQEEDDLDDFDVVDHVPEPSRQAPASPEPSLPKSSRSGTSPLPAGRGPRANRPPDGAEPDAMAESGASPYPAAAVASAEEYVSKLRSRARVQRPRSGSGSGSGKSDRGAGFS